MTSQLPFSETLCPFCGKDNACKVNEPTPCWCSSYTFPKSILELLPESSKKQCICETCIQLYIDNQIKFKSLYCR